MSIPRTIRKAFLAVEQSEGVGARVRRSIGTSQLRSFTPFLMLDHFSSSSGAGFPDHPHRGQETITYLLRGAFDHEDFAGNKGTIETGDLQFMTAGKGIMHAEMPRHNADGSPNVGLQLWVDLPEKLKMTEPRYRDLKAAEIPSVTVDDDKVTIKVISGESHGVDSVKELAYTPVWILDINIKPGGKVRQPLPKGWNAFAYTLSGSTIFGAGGDATTIGQYHNCVFEQQGDVVVAEVASDATEDGHFVLIAGQPLDQKVFQYGPFVMNSQEQIHQAMIDFQSHSNYNVVFSDTFIPEDEAKALVQRPRESAGTTVSTATVSSTPDVASQSDVAAGLSGELSRRSTGDTQGARWMSKDRHGLGSEKHQIMRLHGQKFLCALPVIQTVPRNETAEAAARAEEQKELARATGRGWELLQELGEKCLYLTTGWWSYEFCYNHYIKQYHQQPPQKGSQIFPPQEDLNTPSYILGRTRRSGHQDTKSTTELLKGSEDVETTELQARGEMRYLVQRLGDGTVCDLTGKKRRVEVQFHCHPESTDRIGWVKEITTCSYQMVIYTPRLCNDAAFLPPRENRANTIACREVVAPADVSAWESRTAADAARRLLLQGATGDISDDEASSPPPPPPPAAFIGGVEVGAARLAGGKNSPRIDPSMSVAKSQPEVIAIRNAKSRARRNDGSAGKDLLTAEELKRLKLSSQDMEKLKEQLRKVPIDKGWRVQLVDGPAGDRSVVIVIDPDDISDEQEHDDHSAGDEGSEEEYTEEL
ncbi:MAG: hypothetical protein M1825_002321 [Sarcosagium campestre]|nr:MAG: hypothetical protein M1825_002321 [Sarcosagium campestre]